MSLQIGVVHPGILQQQITGKKNEQRPKKHIFRRHPCHRLKRRKKRFQPDFSAEHPPQYHVTEQSRIKQHRRFLGINGQVGKNRKPQQIRRPLCGGILVKKHKTEQNENEDQLLGMDHVVDDEHRRQKIDHGQQKQPSDNRNEGKKAIKQKQAYKLFENDPVVNYGIVAGNRVNQILVKIG